MIVFELICNDKVCEILGPHNSADGHFSGLGYDILLIGIWLPVSQAGSFCVRLEGSPRRIKKNDCS